MDVWRVYMVLRAKQLQRGSRVGGCKASVGLNSQDQGLNSRSLVIRIEKTEKSSLLRFVPKKLTSPVNNEWVQNIK